MEPASPPPGGYFEALRALGDGVLAGVQDRLELLSLELQEEKFRLIKTFLWISAAVFTAIMAITFVSLTVVYLFWAGARLAVLAGFAAFYAGATVAIVVAFRRFLARQPSPFAATRQEIGNDRACIRNEN
jgi:uncharacterized membrane protein YqjE